MYRNLNPQAVSLGLSPAPSRSLRPQIARLAHFPKLVPADRLSPSPSTCIQSKSVCRRIVQSVQSFATFAIGRIPVPCKAFKKHAVIGGMSWRNSGHPHAFMTSSDDRSETCMLADLNQDLRIDPADLPSDEVIFGGTAAMLEVRRGLDRAVREGLPVLIQGESGTGKEVIAKYLHLQSSFCRRAFHQDKLHCICTFPVTDPAGRE